MIKNFTTIRAISFQVVLFICFRGISTKMFNTVESNYPTNSIQKEAWLKSILIRECPPVAHIEDSSSSTLLQVSVNCSCTLTHRCTYILLQLFTSILHNFIHIFYILACNRTYDSDNGRLLNPSYPYYAYGNTYCDFAIHVPNPRSRISVYFKYFLLGDRGGNCTNDAYFKVGQNIYFYDF